MKLDEFIASEKPITGMTDQACDTYGVHSHAFIMNILGEGHTSINAGHYHTIRNGKVIEAVDDARTVHNHNLLRVPQAPNTASYGIDLGDPLRKDKDGMPKDSGADEHGMPKGADQPPYAKPVLFVSLKECLDSILKGDPSLVWSKIMAVSTPEEIDALNYTLGDKAEMFRARMNDLIDEIFKDSPDRCGCEARNRLGCMAGQPLSAAIALSKDDIAEILGGNHLCESEYAKKIGEYMKDLGNELQIILLMNEGKTWEQWKGANPGYLAESNGEETKPAYRHLADTALDELDRLAHNLAHSKFGENVEKLSKELFKDSKLKKYSLPVHSKADFMEKLLKQVRETRDFLQEMLISGTSKPIDESDDSEEKDYESDAQRAYARIRQIGNTLASYVDRGRFEEHMIECVNAMSKEDYKSASVFSRYADKISRFADDMTEMSEDASGKLGGEA